MNKQNYSELEQVLERKMLKKDKRKKKNMKVSGAGVRKLAKIIREKER